MRVPQRSARGARGAESGCQGGQLLRNAGVCQFLCPFPGPAIGVRGLAEEREELVASRLLGGPRLRRFSGGVGSDERSPGAEGLSSGCDQVDCDD